MSNNKSDSLMDHIAELHSVYKTYDYYRILGLHRNDSIDKIKKAFFNAELKYHPDMYPLIDDHIEKKLAEIFTYINNAYVTLSDPIKRRKYDLDMAKRTEQKVVSSEIRPATSSVQDVIQQNEAKMESATPWKVCEDNGNKARAKFRDGKVAFWDNDFSTAARLFEMAKECDGSVAEYQFMYGRTLGKLGKNKDAVRALNRANELKPSDPDILAELGHLYLKLGFPSRAVSYFKQVIKIDPSNKRAREGMEMAG